MSRGKRRKAAKNTPLSTRMFDDAPLEQKVAQAESARSRYDVDEDDDDDLVYIPPHIDLESMSKDEIASVSMRILGRRPGEGERKDVQIEAVRSALRAGRPTFMRG